MATKLEAAEHHRLAAEHHGHAAKHHHAAAEPAKQAPMNEPDTALNVAHGHHLSATYHPKEAGKALRRAARRSALSDVMQFYSIR
jgi:hypothetical protein